MNTTPAKFLVHTREHELATYWTLEILLIDLAIQRHAPPLCVYELVADNLKYKYVPVTELELRERKKAPDRFQVEQEYVGYIVIDSEIDETNALVEGFTGPDAKEKAHALAAKLNRGKPR